jgi:hypothetical protein
VRTPVKKFGKRDYQEIQNAGEMVAAGKIGCKVTSPPKALHVA